MKLPHFVLIALVIVSCSPKNSSEEKSADSVATAPADSLQNPAGSQTRIEVEAGKATVFIDGRKALSFELESTWLIDNQSNDTTLFGQFDIEEDKGTSLREVALVFIAPSYWVDSEYVTESEINEINNIAWNVSTWEEPDMQSDTRTYQYKFNDMEGHVFVFQLTISSSTYTDPEENIKPIPFDESKYLARFEKMLGTVVQD